MSYIFILLSSKGIIEHLFLLCRILFILYSFTGLKNFFFIWKDINFSSSFLLFFFLAIDFCFDSSIFYIFSERRGRNSNSSGGGAGQPNLPQNNNNLAPIAGIKEITMRKVAPLFYLIYHNIILLLIMWLTLLYFLLILAMFLITLPMILIIMCSSRILFK